MQPQPIKQKSSWSVWVVLLVVLAVAGATYYYFGHAPQRQQAAGRSRFGGDGPVPVLAVAARRADVPIYLDGVGTTKALNTVTVRPQIDGKLIKVSYKEGQDVEAGYVLAEIDPVIYQAQYDQSVAKKAQDEALLANAKMDLDRYTRLAQTNAGPKQQADTQRALVAQDEALVKLDQALIDNAAAMLSYTKIRAPLAGRTGIRQVDQGNIVHASDATGIVIITQLQPISIFFSLPQQQLGQVNSAFAKGPLPVEALGPDNKTVVDRGKLVVVDNQVDQATGTVKLKAEFPNPDLQLWPGQFINVRLLVDTLSQVVVVPTAAIQRGPNGTFVYLLQQDNTVATKNVTVSQQDDQQSVVTSGLEPPQQVVTTGFARLTEGSTVTIGSPDDKVVVPNAAPPRRRQNNPGGVARDGKGYRGGGRGNAGGDAAGRGNQAGNGQGGGQGTDGQGANNAPPSTTQ
jgi:multidrug efflux system membrane fusion protein